MNHPTYSFTQKTMSSKLMTFIHTTAKIIENWWLAFTGDMKQQQDNSGFKSPKAN